MATITEFVWDDVAKTGLGFLLLSIFFYLASIFLILRFSDLPYLRARLPGAMLAFASLALVWSCVSSLAMLLRGRAPCAFIMFFSCFTAAGLLCVWLLRAWIIVYRTTKLERMLQKQPLGRPSLIEEPEPVIQAPEQLFTTEEQEEIRMRGQTQVLGTGARRGSRGMYRGSADSTADTDMRDSESVRAASAAHSALDAAGASEARQRPVTFSREISTDQWLPVRIWQAQQVDDELQHTSMFWSPIFVKWSLMSFFFLVGIALPLGLSASDPEYFVRHESGCESKYAFFLFGACSVVTLCAFFIGLRMGRFTHDFFLRIELRATVVGVAVLVVTWFIVVVTRVTHGYSRIFGVVSSMFVMLCQLWLPLAKFHLDSHAGRRDSAPSDVGATESPLERYLPLGEPLKHSLVRILRHPVMRTHFRRLLEETQRLESLVFYEQVSLLKAMIRRRRREPGSVEQLLDEASMWAENIRDNFFAGYMESAAEPETFFRRATGSFSTHSFTRCDINISADLAKQTLDALELLLRPASRGSGNASGNAAAAAAAAGEAEAKSGDDADQRLSKLMTVFDAAEREVFSLLANNAVADFVRSRHFAAMDREIRRLAYKTDMDATRIAVFGSVTEAPMPSSSTTIASPAAAAAASSSVSPSNPLLLQLSHVDRAPRL